MKKVIISICILSVLLAGVACTRQDEENVDEQVQEYDKEENVKNSLQIETNDDKEEENSQNENMSNKDNNDEGKKAEAIKIYKMNEELTSFITEDIEVDEVTPDSILSEIVDANDLSREIKILEFSNDTMNGEKSITINFNEEFLNYIRSLGSTKEYYVFGVICNSYLEAYDSKWIQVLVNGNEFSTGHNEYAGYFGKFE